MFSNPLKTQSDKKTSKGKLNSSQEDREGKTPYDSSILIKLAVHKDCVISRTRERDQTHSYWNIPSAPRVNYSLLVMETTGMMKMASGDGFPLQQGAGTGSRLVFRGYRGLRRRNSRSRFLSGGFGIYRRPWRWNQVRGTPEGPSSQGARPRGGAPLGLWPPWDSSQVSFCSSIFYIFQKYSS